MCVLIKNNITNVNSHASMYDITTVAFATSDDVSIYDVTTVKCATSDDVSTFQWGSFTKFLSTDVAVVP